MLSLDTHTPSSTLGNTEVAVPPCPWALSDTTEPRIPVSFLKGNQETSLPLSPCCPARLQCNQSLSKDPILHYLYPFLSPCAAVFFPSSFFPCSEQWHPAKGTVQSSSRGRRQVHLSISSLPCFVSAPSHPPKAQELHSKSDEANEDLEVPRRVKTGCTAPSSSAPSPGRCNPTGMSAPAQQDLPDPGVRGHSDGKEGGTAHKKSPATVPLPQRTVIP